jgi:hypothetical protein
MLRPPPEARHGRSGSSAEAGGDAPSHRAFATLQEGTHHNHYGSYAIAKCVVTGIKQAGVCLRRNHVP